MKIRDTKFLDAALEAFERGFQVMPIYPKTKMPTRKWDPWRSDLTEEKIRDYWQRNPDHELGFIVSDGILVLDADTEIAVAAMYEILSAFDITPNLVVQTSRGQHIYLMTEPGTYVKT
ncbi:MAG: bifunctional DNA primase/polymerase, partial [Haliea sp.]